MHSKFKSKFVPHLQFLFLPCLQRKHRLQVNRIKDAGEEGERRKRKATAEKLGEIPKNIWEDKYNFSLTHISWFHASHNDNNENQLTSSTANGFSLCNRKALYYYGNFARGEVFFYFFLFSPRLLMLIATLSTSIAIYITSFLRRLCTLTLFKANTFTFTLM